jgi:predicted RNA-binding protein with PUA-like domain
MNPGDLAFFYHSSCEIPGIAGIMKISSKARPDLTAFDKTSEYFDPKSDPGKPRWFLVDVTFKRRLRRVIPLSEIRTHKSLNGLKLLHNPRLSVMPVTKKEWEYILALE